MLDNTLGIYCKVLALPIIAPLGQQQSGQSISFANKRGPKGAFAPSGGQICFLPKGDVAHTAPLGAGSKEVPKRDP